MSRTITGFVNCRFVDIITKDMIDHQNESTYDVLFLTPVPNSRHNFRILCKDFPKLAFDNPASWSKALL